MEADFEVTGVGIRGKLTADVHISERKLVADAHERGSAREVKPYTKATDLVLLSMDNQVRDSIGLGRVGCSVVISKVQEVSTTGTRIKQDPRSLAIPIHVEAFVLNSDL